MENDRIQIVILGGDTRKSLFSEREIQIASLADMRSNKEIAEMLGLASQTVKNYKTSFRRKTGLPMRMGGPALSPEQKELAGQALTKLEEDIADCAASGWTSQEVAEELELSIPEVQEGLKRIYAKLQITGYGKIKKLKVIQLAKAHPKELAKS